MNDPSTPTCGACGNRHAEELGEACLALREAAAAGARPEGVPLRVYGGYLEARAALRAEAPAVATRVLQWLLSYLAEERGVPAEREFPAKLRRLREDDVISERMQLSLFSSALSVDEGPEKAWALMSLVEHAFYRLYLKP